MSVAVHREVTGVRAPHEKWVSRVPLWHDATPKQKTLLEAAWRSGDLGFQFTPSQLDTYRKIRRWEKTGEGRVYCIDIGRRWGKSRLMLTMASEDAIRQPGARIVYCAPTYEMVRKIILPLMAEIMRSCPPALQAEWVKSEGVYIFPNGSRIELIGLDLRPDGARGTGVDKVYLDESGFFDSLEYLVVSVLFPQMLGRDWARIIAASTPPKTPQHYWSLSMVPEAVKRVAHDKKTLDDASQYSQEEIDYFYSLMPGGRNGVAARREYGAEHIADTDLQIIPEFGDAEKDIVREVPAPLWRDCYVSLDPGYHDLSGVLFGYWHFVDQVLVIEDELALPRLNSKRLADKIKAKEIQLWAGVRRRGNGFDTRPQPYLRVSDRDPRLLADLQIDHKLTFVPTQKDHLIAQVDQVRVAIQSGKIVIHPRCKTLILHCRNGVWKKDKIGVTFAREGDFGHFDLIASLVYLWRNVNKRRNPVPPLERFVCGDLREKPANDNGGRKTLAEIAAAQYGAASKWRREGNRWFIRSGKVGT